MTLTSGIQSAHTVHRAQRVRLATLWSIIAKFGSLLVTLVSIPLAVSTLGQDRFGIWITITTFFSLFSFLDGGIGNAVINMVADQRAAQNEDRLRRVISSAYLLLCVIGASGCLIGGVFSFLIDWKWAISLPANITSDEIAISALIVGSLFFLNIPLSLVARIRQGLQETHINSVFDVLSYCTILGGTTIAWYFQASLNGFLLAFALGPVIANAANTMLLIFQRGSSLAPRFSLASNEIARDCIATGSVFLGLQICAALAFQTDALIVSHLIGLPAAAELGLVNRVFLVATSVTGFFIAPLWPAFRDAAARGEMEWVKRVFIQTLRNSLLISLAITLPILVAYKPLITAWTGKDILPSLQLVAAVFIWTNMLVVGNLLAMLLNGLHIVKLQLLLSSIMTISNLVISLVLTLYMGTSGVVWGSIVSYTVCILVPYWILFPRVIHSRVAV